MKMKMKQKEDNTGDDFLTIQFLKQKQIIF